MDVEMTRPGLLDVEASGPEPEPSIGASDSRSKIGSQSSHGPVLGEGIVALVNDVVLLLQLLLGRDRVGPFKPDAAPVIDAVPAFEQGGCRGRKPASSRSIVRSGYGTEVMRAKEMGRAHCLMSWQRMSQSVTPSLLWTLTPPKNSMLRS